MDEDFYTTGLEPDPDLNLGSFNLGNVNGIDLSVITDNKPSPVVQGEDGNMYLSNAYFTPSGWKTDPDFSTPVYYFAQPLELGDARGNYYDVDPDTGEVTQQGAWRTEEEIKGYWDADQGMGYFKEANPNLDWDTYWNFIQESSALGAQGLNRTDNPDEYSELVNKYGFNTSYQNNDGDLFQWNGSNFTKTFKVDDSVPVGDLIMSVALGAMTAGVAGPAISGVFGGGAAGGAATGVVSSAISQGIVSGKIDPTSLATAGVLGGLGGWFNDLNAATPGTYGGWVVNGQQIGNNSQWMIEKIQTLSSSLGIPFAEASGIVQGVLTGTITGGDLESIALNAVGGFSNVKIQQYLQDAFGDGFDVENWFREGNSFIPTEALFPFVKTAIQGAIDGGVSDEDLLKMLGGYFQAGGDLDFVLPSLPNITVSGDFCEKYPDFPVLCKGLGIEGPSVEIDSTFEFTCPDISIPNGTQKQKPPANADKNTSIGDCIPDIIECFEGFKLDGGNCVPDVEITNPCGPNASKNVQGICECLEDFIDNGDGKGCVPVPTFSTPCEEGFIDNGDGKGCVPVPDINCGPNASKNAQGICECLEDFIDNGDGKGCVKISTGTTPEIPVCEDEDIENGKIVRRLTTWGCQDYIECIEGFELKDQKCVEIEGGPEVTGCGEGEKDYGDGNGCVPEINCPDENQEYNTELGECVDIDLPDFNLPDLNLFGGVSKAADFNLAPTQFSTDPQLLTASQFPITDFLSGMFSSKNKGTIA